MRKQILGATAAILSAGALSTALPATPTYAASWKSTTALPLPAGTVTDVDAVSTGPGDAVAAAIINGVVWTATATNGVWGTVAQVSNAVDATGLVIAANDKNDVVVGWVEDVSGDLRLRVSRKFTSDYYYGQKLVTPAGTDVVGKPDIGIADNGLVVATAAVDSADADNELVVTEWPEGAEPGTSKVLAPAKAWNPSLDVSSKGAAVIAFTYTGLVDSIVDVTRRTPGQGWSLPASTKPAGPIAAQPDAAISDNGQGQVIFASVVNGFYVAETSRVLPDGTVQAADAVSPLDEYAYAPSVDINADGSALFAWVAKSNGLARVRYASAADASSPGTSSLLPGQSSDITDVVARVSDDGLRALQVSSGSFVTTSYRSTAVQPFVSSSTTSGFAADQALDVDSEGNAVSVVFKASGAQGRFLDASGPVVALDPLPADMLTNPPLPMTIFPISWTMSDTLSSITGSDVYATTAKWNEAGHSAPYVIRDNVPGSKADIPWILGTSYCFQVRPTDTAGNSTTSEKQCTTIPLDDRALVGDGWNEITHTGNFRNTLVTTTHHGRTLTRTGVRAKRLALVVRKVADGGSVKVTFAGTVLGTYSLKGTGQKKVIPLATYANVRTGTLKIQVTSAEGKLVSIDGLVVAK